MKIRLQYFSIVLTLLAGIHRVAAQATLIISPAVISNTYVGPIAMNISGLVTGETVELDHYVDVNTNGVIDTNDLLVASFRVTDGQVATIGGVTNLNVPGDLNAANGTITTVLNYLKTALQYPTGTHLFRLSSVAGNWPPVTNSLTITNYPFPQVFNGKVVSGSSNVPYAFVGAKNPASGFNGFGFADSGGNYSLPVATGSYTLLAFKPGYVYDLDAAPSFNPSAPGTNTTNLSLVAATTTLGGGLIDSANTNHGLPGVFMFLKSSGGFAASGWTDTNGNFKVPVTADIWGIQLQESSGLAGLGYLEMSGNFNAEPFYDTTGATVTNAFIPLPKGTAMFYGRITNSTGSPLAGIQFFTSPNNNSNIYTGLGVSDTNGNYTALTQSGTNGTNWSVQLDSPGPTNYVVSSGGNSSFNNNQAVAQLFLAEPATGVIMGQVTNNAGAPVSGIEVNGTISVGAFSFQSVEETAGNGAYALPAFNGDWSVQPNNNNSEDGLNGNGYNGVDGQSVTLSSASATANFTVYPLGAAVLSSPVFSRAGQLSFQLNAVNGYNYYVQVSTNLANGNGWATILTTNLQTYSITVQDSQATNQARFYRAVKQ
jgi:hypothetical protein